MARNPDKLTESAEGPRKPGPKGVPRRILRWVVLIAMSYAIFLGLVVIFENKLIFYPTKYPDGDWKPAGLVFEDAWFQGDDGTKLHGWFVPHQNPKAVMLVAHGNGGNLSGRAELLRELHRCGVATMIFDYRGYGRSAGSANGENIVADARAARRWLAQRTGTPPEDLVLLGESLGGAVAVQLAADCGARGLIVENSFNSLTDVAVRHYPWLPVRLLLRTKLEPGEAIRKYHGPLLQVHGDRDTVVPYELGRRLFDAANQPKEFVTVHNGEHDHMSVEFRNALARFLDRL